MTMKLRYPIYIPSKGRADCALTPHALDEMRVPYYLVVEDVEYDQYARYYDTSKLLRLPFSNLGQGSIPARNWIWDHASASGVSRHWIIDDNVNGFARLNFNRRIPVRSSAIFRCVEDFTDRFTNVAFSGLNYRNFAPDRSPTIAPFRLNTRIYSITLINNALPYRWRGRYNEDTDICLRALKDGWCTILFNAFLGNKLGTMRLRGGNTDNVYNTGDSRLAFAESLQQQHPDVVDVVWKFDRWHHSVNYDMFKRNKLQYKSDVTPIMRSNEYGMVLRRVCDRVAHRPYDTEHEDAAPMFDSPRAAEHGVTDE